AAVRVEGVAPSVTRRKATLQDVLKPFGTLMALEPGPSAALWAAIRDVAPFAADGPAGQRIVWRLSTAPKQGAAAARMIAQQSDDPVLFERAGRHGRAPPAPAAHRGPR